MKSVPPRGSEWAVYIANCRFPIANWSVPQLAIGIWQLAILRPTRCRSREKISRGLTRMNANLKQ